MSRFLNIPRVPIPAHKNKKRGGVVSTRKANPDHRGFSTQDILWAVGIWSVILSLSPVVLFYVLMVR